jgi:hypothetical protein
MSDNDLYRVLYTDADGQEQLTGAMTLEQAYSRARDLEGQGYAVGSVMGDVAARGCMHARYSPTYRGVKVPDGLRADGQPYSVFDAWKRGVDVELDAPKVVRLDVYRGVQVPSRILSDREQNGAYSALFAAGREGVDAALDTAADEIVRETRSATGRSGVSEVWDMLNRHAAKLADHLRTRKDSAS